jgi:hypothetical protein
VEKRMVANEELTAGYVELFINRPAYTLQSATPDPRRGRHYYYRPRLANALSPRLIRRHLEGDITLGLYAINPETQRCKWVAIDADYENALEDLLKLQWELAQDGVEAALEKSRRGGHLWILCQQPLLARDCRVFIFNLAMRLKVPLKGAGLALGIEVFPKQNEVPADAFGNSVRGPLGIHRADGRRYWFYGADYTLQAQLQYLSHLRKLTGEQLARSIAGCTMPEQVDTRPKPQLPRFAPGRREFRILDYVQPRFTSGANYYARCPSCARQGQDRSRDNLGISISDPRKYRCWAGCTKEMIRAALGCPIRTRVAC